MPKLLYFRSEGISLGDSNIDYWPMTATPGYWVTQYNTANPYLDILETDMRRSTGGLYNRPYIYFDGTGARYLKRSGINDIGTDNLSFSCWIKPDDVGVSSRAPLVSKIARIYPSSTATVGYAIFLYAGNWYVYIQYGSIAGQYSIAYAEHGLSISSDWTHIAFTIDRNSGWAKFYRNGEYVNISAFSIATNGISLNNSNDFIIGYLYDGNAGTGVRYTGGMTEVWFYTGTWSNGDIWQIYNNI